MPKVETFNRKEVIEKASKVFHEKGYNATSMQDLVDATGLNRSSIYNSFDCKLNLFLECLSAYQDFYGTKTQAALSGSTNAIDAIRSVFEMYLGEASKVSTGKGCMITNCKSEMAHQQKTITKFLENNQTSTLKLFEDLIARGQSEGSINTLKPSSTYALYLYSSLQGFRMTGILVSDRKQLKSVIETILQTIT